MSLDQYVHALSSDSQACHGTEMAALQLAEGLEDTDHQLRALYGLWCNHVYTGHPREGVQLAERFRAVATKAGNPADLLIGERLMGVALHFLGAQTPARGYTERMLERYESLPGGSDLVRFHFEQRAVARVTLSRILWLQGFADQAMRTVERGVEDALAVQQDFLRANPQLVAHLPARRLRELTEGRVVQQAYRALWKRDVQSAHKLFRHVGRARSFGIREVRHVASALLPFGAYRWLVGLADRNER
jgi:hypothetical protein